MNPDEVNPYFYDDLKAFLQERGQAKVQAARQKYLEDLVGDSTLDGELISSLSREQRIDLLPHFVATSSWCNVIGVGILNLYESVPEEEMRKGLQRKGYDLVDFDDFIQVLQRLRVVESDKSTNCWEQQLLRDEAERSSLQFRLSYLERNQNSDFLFSSGLISSKGAYNSAHDRTGFISRVSKIVGFDEELVSAFSADDKFYGQLAFKKADHWYHGKRGMGEGSDVKQYLRDEFRRAFDFMGAVNDIVDNARNPEILRELNRTTYDNEFSLMSKEDMDERSSELFYDSATIHRYEGYWLELLKIVDSDEVAGYLTDKQNRDIFRSRLNEFRKFITEQGAILNVHQKKIAYDDHTVEHVHFTEETFGDYVLQDLRNLHGIVSTIDDIIATTPKDSVERSVIEREKRRIVEELQREQKIEAGNSGFLATYLTALSDPNTARRVVDHDVWQMGKHEFFAKEIYHFDERLTAPLSRERIRLGLPDDESKRLLEYLPKFRRVGIEDKFSEFALNNPKSAVETTFTLSAMGSDADAVLTKVQRGEYQLNAVKDNIDLLSNKGLVPTSFLLAELHASEDKGRTLDSWLEEMQTFRTGNFDPTNELHNNLEYTRFRRVVEHEKLRKHIKNHFTFTDYLTIFEKQDGTGELSLSEQDRFEVDCVAHEATLLRDYVLGVKERADELGRDVVVVPNLSYGYLPVSPIAEELEDAGIDTIIGVKIGSTESHSNREVVNSRLFKGYRTKVANKQPVVIVVDGTYNLVTINNRNATARYPDAHQGYLNQVIALNEAMGFTDEDYSHVGKSSDDVSRLRGTEEFKRAVDVYKGVLRGVGPRQPYQFQLWNTAEIELAVRGNREIATTVRPYDGNVKGPTMIFCNVGVLDEQVPEEIKARFEGQHKPAYFDDSGKIIAFDFGFDNFGVRYLNRLETEVKSAYDKLNGREERAPETIPTPAIIGYAMRNLRRTSVEERAV